MVANLRFYAELNDLATHGNARGELRAEFGVSPSVKDAIERFGVPHTEVEVVLVNGESVDFSHRIGDGDQVSVFPAFRHLGAFTGTLRPVPRACRFVADAHLATLARYLRLLGFDTSFHPRAPDEALVAAALSERRIVLTRDSALLKRRVLTDALLVRDDDPEEQLLDVVSRFHLGGRLEPYTRCMACNGLLADADEAEVAALVPPRTRAVFHRFRRCSSCGRVYWDGAHRARLDALVAAARRTAGAHAPRQAC